MKIVKLLTSALLGLALSANSFATETSIMVRAMANDAKYIGTSVGGVKVIVEDAETGEILDQGWINGGTGSTKAIIKEPITRGQVLSDDKTDAQALSILMMSYIRHRSTLIADLYNKSIEEDYDGFCKLLKDNIDELSCDILLQKFFINLPITDLT